ncbi:hypothetical protein GJ496_000675 [Pomphorhynchus laevis]|nr:hypothetical protein GJ496_000675 [Pomphorhynchus laevis]
MEDSYINITDLAKLLNISPTRDMQDRVEDSKKATNTGYHSAVEKCGIMKMRICNSKWPAAPSYKLKPTYEIKERYQHNGTFIPADLINNIGSNANAYEIRIHLPSENIETVSISVNEQCVLMESKKFYLLVSLLTTDQTNKQIKKRQTDASWIANTETLEIIVYLSNLSSNGSTSLISFN